MPDTSVLHYAYAEFEEARGGIKVSRKLCGTLLLTGYGSGLKGLLEVEIPEGSLWCWSVAYMDVVLIGPGSQGSV